MFVQVIFFDVYALIGCDRNLNFYCIVNCRCTGVLVYIVLFVNCDIVMYAYAYVC